MTGTKWMRETTPMPAVAAVFLGISQIQCTLPDANHSYALSIANNGIDYSTTEIIILNYDPVCVACNFTSGTCMPRVCNSNSEYNGFVIMIVECLSSFFSNV